MFCCNCGQGCATNCDNTSEWAGRCCEWVSNVPGVADALNGLIIDFGPTDTLVTDYGFGRKLWRSEIIDIPGSGVIPVTRHYIIAPGGLGVTRRDGWVDMAVGCGGLKLALSRFEHNDANCGQNYNMWMGWSTSVQAVPACEIKVYTPRGTVLYTITDPLEIKLGPYPNPYTLQGTSQFFPCDGSNNQSSNFIPVMGTGGVGAAMFGGGFLDPTSGGEGRYTSNCNLDLLLRFGRMHLGWPCWIALPGGQYVTFSVWSPIFVGCGVRLYSNPFSYFSVGLSFDDTKLPITVKRPAPTPPVWTVCPNGALNTVAIAPNQTVNNTVQIQLQP